MSRREAQGPGAGSRGGPGRDAVLAKKRARLALIERLDRHQPGRAEGGPRVSPIRLLAEVDLALSEHRQSPGA